MANQTKTAAKVGGRKNNFVKVKTAKGRKSSSTRWLQRQLNDPYVAEANRQNFRSRAAFKIIQLDEKYKFFGRGKTIVDLGCAPGGWTQIAVQRNKNSGKIVGLDILDTEAIEGATLIKKDFTENDAPDMLFSALDGAEADIVMSDMAANTTGHQSTDHIRTIALVEMAWDFAKQILAKDGIFIAKVFQGGANKELLDDVKLHFKKITHFKPDASRKGSPETYLVAQGFKGRK